MLLEFSLSHVKNLVAMKTTLLGYLFDDCEQLASVHGILQQGCICIGDDGNNCHRSDFLPFCEVVTVNSKV